MHEAFIEGDVMGILDDLAMGFGLKERTADYDARTARNIATSEAAGNWGNPGGYSMSPSMMMRESQIRNRNQYDTTSGAAGNYLARQGYKTDKSGRVTNPPRPVDSGYTGLSNLLFSAPMNPNSPSLSYNPASPTPAAIGPLKMEQPLGIPGVSMILSMLEGFRPKPLGDNQFIPYNPNALNDRMDPLMAQGLEEYFDMYNGPVKKSLF